MKRIALGLVAVGAALSFAAPASATHEICLPVIDFTGIPICIDTPVLK